MVGATAPGRGHGTQADQITSFRTPIESMVSSPAMWDRVHRLERLQFPQVLSALRSCLPSMP